MCVCVWNQSEHLQSSHAQCYTHTGRALTKESDIAPTVTIYSLGDLLDHESPLKHTELCSPFPWGR